MQSDLASAQTNLDMQEKKISDVEFLVNNLFSKVAVDRISANDTNYVAYQPLDDDEYHFAIKLRFAPIKGSVQLIIAANNGFPQTFYYDNLIYKNVIFYDLHKYNINNTSFTIQYIKDTRETNLVNRMEFKGGKGVYLDDVFVPVSNF